MDFCLKCFIWIAKMVHSTEQMLVIVVTLKDTEVRPINDKFNKNDNGTQLPAPKYS